MMTEQEKKRLKEEEEKKKRQQVKKEDYSRIITEDGTLASFNFNDNYK